MYGNNDWRDYLEHGWGHSPEQKKREKEYNAWYYQKFKEKWKKYNSKTITENVPDHLATRREKNVTGTADPEALKKRKLPDGTGVGGVSSFNQLHSQTIKENEEWLKDHKGELHPGLTRNEQMLAKGGLLATKRRETGLLATKPRYERREDSFRREENITGSAKSNAFKRRKRTDVDDQNMSAYNNPGRNDDVNNAHLNRPSHGGSTGKVEQVLQDEGFSALDAAKIAVKILAVLNGRPIPSIARQKERR